MEEWFIKLKGNGDDLAYLCDMLSFPQAEVVQEDDVYYLKSVTFNDQDDAHEAHLVASELLCQLIGTARIVSNQALSVSIVGIERTNGDKPRTQYILAGFLAPTGRLFAPSLVRVGDTVPVQRQESYLENVARKVSVDQAVARVTRLFGATSLNWVDLYRVLEIVQYDVGSYKRVVDNGWVSEADLRLFTHTANNPAASGDDARHGATKQSPPDNPMSLSEAQKLIIRVANYWLQTKFGDSAP